MSTWRNADQRRWRGPFRHVRNDVRVDRITRLDGRNRRPRPAQRPIPKLLDLADGHATDDQRFWHTRPDWTYDHD